MNPRNNRQFILAICISLIFVACGGDDKKTDDAKTADSASAAKADTVKPAAQDASVDAVKAAPDLYKTISDTLGIRIVEATYKPGDSSAMHSHPDYALYVIEGGTAQFTEKDGTKGVNEMKSGMENIRPSEFHSVKNVGKTTVKVLLVEVNRPRGTAPAGAPLDATKVAADRYKLIKDTLGIRIVEATYKAGESSVMHSHPDLAMYAITGGNAEFTDKEGKKMTQDLKAGTTMVTPATTHSVKNVGKTTVKVLLVEVNRPLK